MGQPEMALKDPDDAVGSVSTEQTGPTPGLLRRIGLPVRGTRSPFLPTRKPVRCRSDRPHIMILLCQGAGGLWTGLGWATSWDGQALIRSHGPPRLVGGVDRSLSGQHAWCVSRLIGSDSTQGSGEVFEGLSGYVAFEAAHDLWCGEPFGSSPGHIGSGLGMAAHPGEDDPVEGGVGLTVTAPVEPVSGRLA